MTVKIVTKDATGKVGESVGREETIVLIDASFKCSECREFN